MTPATARPFIVQRGDCREVLATLEAASIDAIVTDPPYELGFMNKAWDKSGIAYDLTVWRECLRVLKPGGHLIAFGGSRTYHRLACAVEDAGFEVRDQVLWLYGSGFPKSLDVSRAIDKETGLERIAKPWLMRERKGIFAGEFGDNTSTSGNLQCPDCGKWKFAHDYCRCPRDSGPATDVARQWSGWGTALKPAHEPAVLARKPLIGTVAENVLTHGTGGLHIDACRVGDESVTINTWDVGAKPFGGGAGHAYTSKTVTGRWPANLIHDGSEAATEIFPGEDDGSAARFFYCAKASKADREHGLSSDAPVMDAAAMVAREADSAGIQSPRAGAGRTSGSRNHHPTVKPIALMRHLVRLITPPGGIVLDPFAGSGSTGVAARLEGMRFLGIEQAEEYAAIAEARIAGTVPDTPEHAPQMRLFA